jgi:hypothetical protein
VSRPASREDTKPGMVRGLLSTALVPLIGFLCSIEQAFGDGVTRSRRSESLYPRLTFDLHCHDEPYPREWE